MAKISKRSVEALKPGGIIADQEVKGFVARRLASGKITYGFRYRDKTTGKQRWLGLGLHGTISPEQARDAAKSQAGEVAKAKDPVAERMASRAEATQAAKAAVNTVNAVLDDFERLYRKRGNLPLRSAEQIKQIFKKHVRPVIGNESIYSLKRSHIVSMLDGIKKKSGPVISDRVFAHLRKAFNWQAIRDEDFTPPIVKGMSANGAKRRDRVLDDQEIRAVWSALDDDTVPEAFRLIVRELLLTAQRRDEVAKMHSDELAGDVWTIPQDRAKNGRDHVVPLSAQARRWIGNRSGFIFSTTDGKKPFSGYSKAKRALDAVIARQRKVAGLEPLPNWTLHDLRRTGRTLMSRAGVDPDTAERVLNHAIEGVRGVYDRFGYLEEKRDALDKLAGLIAQITERKS